MDHPHQWDDPCNWCGPNYLMSNLYVLHFWFYACPKLLRWQEERPPPWRIKILIFPLFWRNKLYLWGAAPIYNSPPWKKRSASSMIICTPFTVTKPVLYGLKLNSLSILVLGPGREAPIVIQHHTTWTYGTYRICSVYNFWCTYTYLVYCHLTTYIDNCINLPIRVAILLLGKLTPHLACKTHKIQIDFQIKYLRPTDILASFNIILSTNDVRVQAKTSNWCIDWLKAMLSIVFHNSCL